MTQEIFTSDDRFHAALVAAVFSFLMVPIVLVSYGMAVWFAYQAYQGERFENPAITEIAKGQVWLIKDARYKTHHEEAINVQAS